MFRSACWERPEAQEVLGAPECIPQELPALCPFFSFFPFKRLKYCDAVLKICQLHFKPPCIFMKRVALDCRRSKHFMSEGNASCKANLEVYFSVCPSTRVLSFNCTPPNLCFSSLADILEALTQLFNQSIFIFYSYPLKPRFIPNTLNTHYRLRKIEKKKYIVIYSAQSLVVQNHV